MARALVLGNGNMLVGLDQNGYVRECFYPHVSMQSHIAKDSSHRIGVWADNRLSWLDHSEWKTTLDCYPKSLAGSMTKVSDALGLELHFTDTVYNEKNIFIRKVVVINKRPEKRVIKLFFAQEFEIDQSKSGDTAYYDPRSKTVIHYKGRRVFSSNLCSGEKYFSEFTTGVYGIEGKAGSYKDAEDDGTLQKNPIEHGHTDSVLSIPLTCDPNTPTAAYYWLVAAKSIEEAHNLDQYVRNRKPESLMKTTIDYWTAWLEKYDFHFQGLTEDIIHLFQKSLLYMRTHADSEGAIIASCDTSMLQDGKDTYAYMWPRDAAFTALALARSGDEHVAQNLFAFCNDVITDAGYLMHKYRADKSLGSSWHPWFKNGKTILPIQEDETALVLFALYEHYLISRDLEFIESIYNSFIKKSAQFLMQYRNSKTGLPEPSYDLWEEKFGVHTFTAASVVGALNAAASFADLLGKTPEASLYREVANDMKTGIMTHLYDEKNQNFYKGLTLDGHQQWVPEPTVDASSVYGIFAFGVLEPTDPRLKKAFHQSAQLLTIQTEVGGIARYVGDTYYRTTEHAPGNPWILTTLWFAQYYAAIAKTNSDLDLVVENLSWAVRHAFPSGVLAEQLDPYTGKRLSAAPLTWSHAEFVRTVFAHLDALERLGICQTCNPIK